VTLIVDIALQSADYQAAGENRLVAEWPPHPARVFCALVASACCAEDHSALRWLEDQPAPDIHAAARAMPVLRSAYVVTNAVKKGGGSQFHPGRNNALRSRAAAVTSSARVRIVWSGAAPDPALVRRLDQMARRVPYLGRSSGLAMLSCQVADVADAEPELVCFEPALGEDGDYQLRVPFRGYLDALADQYRQGRPSWEISRTVGYRQRTGDNTEPEGARVQSVAAGEIRSVYTDVIVMRFERYRPDGSLAAVFTEALRRAVMSVTPDPLPVALHGHDAPGRPHVAFLALPDVGHSHADSRLLGMAVAIPELPDVERRAIVRGVLSATRVDDDEGHGGRAFHLEVPRLGEVVLTYRPGLVRPWALDPRRWRQGSDQWVSATPVVLDRYPRHGDIEAEIVRSCLAAGLPEPDDLVVSTSPLVTGGVRLRPRDLPKHAQSRIYRHVSLHFPRRVAGPVLLGAGRYLGIGLLAPVLAAQPGVKAG
jgi:CRISPR-associated protein Csb2